MPGSNKKGKPQRDNFYMTPRIVNTLGLSLIAYRLYGQVKDVTGEDGRCHLGTRALAAACGMSLASVSDAKHELVKAGLIHIGKVRGNGGYRDDITVVDIWHENHAMYHQTRLSVDGEGVPSGEHLAGEGVPSGEHLAGEGVPPGEQGVPPGEHPQAQRCSPGGTEQDKDLIQQDGGTTPGEKRARKTEIDDVFRASLKERFAGKLTDIDERIDEALAHKAARSYSDLQVYVRNWLRRDAERISKSQGRATRVEPSNDLSRYKGKF